jgi:hypothetical protein
MSLACCSVQEAELLEGLLPDSDDVVLGLADGGGQKVSDILEDLADGLRRDGFFG